MSNLIGTDKWHARPTDTISGGKLRLGPECLAALHCTSAQLPEAPPRTPLTPPSPHGPTPPPRSAPAAQRPNTGAGGILTLPELKDRGYRRVPDEQAEEAWTFW